MGAPQIGGPGGVVEACGGPQKEIFGDPKQGLGGLVEPFGGTPKGDLWGA